MVNRVNDFDLSTLPHIQFIDHHQINWQEVRRTRCLFYQRFNYEYPGPIRDLKQRLIVIPADQYGAQQLRDHSLIANPPPTAIREAVDPFGNRVLELELMEADRNVVFEVLMIVESEAQTPNRLSISPAEADYWLHPTPLTQPDKHIEAIARQLQDEAKTPHDLAQRINEHVYAIMRYQNDVTTVETTAAQALILGRGLCQDFAHLMLSICRTAGLPARYVSGHLLGEGGSHAWVEVLLPSEGGLAAVGFDPTNNRHPNMDYVVVAVGRDYRDVSPVSGSFTAPYAGRLTCSKRAGLTLVEFHNGETLHCQPIQ